MKINLKNISVYWYQLAIIALVVLLLITQIHSCNKRKQLEKQNVALVNAINDTLHTVVNKDSSKTSSISVIQTPTPQEFLDLKIANEEIKRLQVLVEANKKKLKPGSSVSIGSVETNVSHTGKTTVILPDTLPKQPYSVKYIYPIYKDTLKNKWIEYDMSANKDSSTFHLKVYNNFSAVIGYDKGKPYASITTDNPYSAVKSLRTYQVIIPPAKKWGIGFSAGVTVNNNFKPTPYIGVGVNYNIIKF